MTCWPTPRPTSVNGAGSTCASTPRRSSSTRTARRSPTARADDPPSRVRRAGGRRGRYAGCRAAARLPTGPGLHRPDAGGCDRAAQPARRRAGGPGAGGRCGLCRAGDGRGVHAPRLRRHGRRAPGPGAGQLRRPGRGDRRGARARARRPAARRGRRRRARPRPGRRRDGHRGPAGGHDRRRGGRADRPGWRAARRRADVDRPARGVGRRGLHRPAPPRARRAGVRAARPGGQPDRAGGGHGRGAAARRPSAGSSARRSSRCSTWRWPAPA